LSNEDEGNKNLTKQRTSERKEGRKEISLTQQKTAGASLSSLSSTSSSPHTHSLSRCVGLLTESLGGCVESDVVRGDTNLNVVERIRGLQLKRSVNRVRYVEKRRVICHGTWRILVTAERETVDTDLQIEKR
jgi:hypothetical protein